MSPKPRPCLREAVFVVWGLGGVLLLLGSAVWRLGTRATEAFVDFQWSPLQWGVALAWLFFMAYSEGWRGFHRGFSPRIVARCRALSRRCDNAVLLLAPLACVGFFRATRKRRIVSVSVAFGILVLVFLVQFLEQPWRGIIALGVVVGLAMGMGSILFFSARWAEGCPTTVPTDIPPKE